MKTAVTILSDPKSGAEEALGRLFNGLAAALEAHRAGDEVKILFQGAGTRWPAVLADPQHPAHGLFGGVKALVHGVSCACADVFGARAGVEASGLPLLRENALPGTEGLASLRQLRTNGFEVLVF